MVYNVTLDDGSSVLLVRARNPWGSDLAYNGTWWDGSSAWTPKVIS